MNEMIFISGFVYGMFAGLGITGYFILSYLHHKWYGTYFVRMENLPLTEKIKNRLDLNDDFIFKE